MRSILVAGVVLAAATGCETNGEEPASRAAQVYIATIRQAMAGQPRPVGGPEVLPVVYVVAVGEEPIDAGVQAEVAGLLREESEVRFADERAQAINPDLPAAPVRDDGVLVAVGDLSPEGPPVELPVEVYRSAEVWSKAVLTLGEEASSGWSVTSSSLVGEP